LNYRTLFKSIVLSGAVIAATLPSVAFAADHSKYAVIDIRQIIENSAKSKAISEKLQSEFRTKEESILKLESDLKDKQDNLQKNRDVMKADERENSKKDLENLKKEYQRQQFEFNDSLSVRQQEEMQNFMLVLKEVVDKYAQKNHYDLVLPSDAVLYFNASFDKTMDIVKLLDSTKNEG